MNPQGLSVCRKRVYELQGKRAQLERIALGHRPMVAGSLIERRFRPGGVVAYYLSIPTERNSWHRYVRKEEVEHYRRRAEGWREFVHGMAEWVRVNKEIEENLRRLGSGRCEEVEIRRRGR